MKFFARRSIEELRSDAWLFETADLPQNISLRNCYLATCQQQVQNEIG